MEYVDVIRHGLSSRIEKGTKSIMPSASRAFVSLSHMEHLAVVEHDATGALFDVVFRQVREFLLDFLFKFWPVWGGQLMENHHP